MASYREEEDPFEEDIVFDQAGLLTNTTKMNTAIRRVSSGKCALFAKTLGLCGAFFGLGLCIAIPGPTSPITELQANISPISSIYAARSSGYLIGSIIGGILFDHFNRLFLLFISLLLTAVFITVTPWCNILWLLEACMVFLGMTMGFLDTGGNVLCLDLWGRNSGPFMQALHFSFGLGAFVAPLLAVPFLQSASVNVSPAVVASTILPFEISDVNTVGVERGKRDILKSENITNMITSIESSNSSWLLENTTLPSEQVNSVIVTTIPNVDFTELNTTEIVYVSETTTHPVATTQRVTKHPKPSKTKGSSFDDKTWNKNPVKEELKPVATSTSTTTTTIPTTTTTITTTTTTIPTTTTTTTTIPTTTTTTPSTTTPSTTTTTEPSNKQPFLLTAVSAKEMKTTYLFNESVTGLYQNMNEERNTESYKKDSNYGMSNKLKSSIENATQSPDSDISKPQEPDVPLYHNIETDVPSTTLPKHVHHSKPGTYDNDTDIVGNSLYDFVANRIEKYGFNKVQFTYLMVGLFVFAISLVFLGFLCHNPRDPKSKQEEGQGTKKISNRALHALLISLMAIFFLLYVGLEVTYGQLVLAFAVHGNLQLARPTGLVIAIVFWGSFAAMRFASIFFSSGFGPVTMLLLNFVFCTLGTVLLSTLASHAETALWVGTALLGIGLASIFPTGILWIERYIHVSNKVAAAFVTGASLGEMLCPVAVYRLMINNPAMLMHSAVVINVLCIATFVALRWLAVRHGEKYCTASNNGYQLANQDEEEDMIDMSPSGRRHSFSSEHRALLNGNPHRGP